MEEVEFQESNSSRNDWVWVQGKYYMRIIEKKDRPIVRVLVEHIFLGAPTKKTFTFLC